jgi:hypothetical protein
MAWLYRYETKGIQRWILDSNKLRDLAAGSALIEALAERGRSEAERHGAEVVQAAAGGMTALFPGREALEAFAAEWPMRVTHHAPGLHVVQGWVPLEGVDEQTAHGQLRDKLEARRNAPLPAFPEAGPWIMRAGRSGLPAVPTPLGLRGTSTTTQWDEATRCKERARARLKDGAEHPLLPGVRFHEELERWPEGPVAVVHVDGSGVGQRLAQLNPDRHGARRFSAALREALTAGVLEALGSVTESGDGRRCARPVVLGGDDVTLVLLATDALGLVVTLLSAFEAETAQRAASLGGALHAGAGVTVVTRGYPFYRAYDLAERACRYAKRAAVDASGRPEASALRLVRATASLELHAVGDEDEGRGELAPTAERGVSWRLGEVAALERLLTAVSELPRGPLRSWLSLLERDRAEVGRAGPRSARGDELPHADAAWTRAREIAESERWSDLEAALRAVGADPQTGRWGPDAPRDRAGRTPLVDALSWLQIRSWRPENPGARAPAEEGDE